MKADSFLLKKIFCKFFSKKCFCSYKSRRVTDSAHNRSTHKRPRVIATVRLLIPSMEHRIFSLFSTMFEFDKHLW